MPGRFETFNDLGGGVFNTYTKGVLTGSTQYKRTITLEKWLMTSAGHLWPVPKKMRDWYNSGGAFAKREQTITRNFYKGTQSFQANANTKYEVTGLLLPVSMNTSRWTTVAEPDMTGLGTKGYTITAPTKPKAQVAQALIELKQLPKLPFIKAMKEKGRYFRNLQRNLGDEYLNVAFGWKPFISDVKDATKAALKAKKTTAQFIRDSGRLVRRRYEFPLESNMNPPSIIQGSTPDPVYWGNVLNAGTTTIQSGTQKRAWFVAAYKYYVPPVGTDWLSNIKHGESINNKLYGTRVDPALLWELAPWSWLADYFGNVGDIITNFTRFSQDNLAAKYAYIMVETTSIRTYTWTGTAKQGGESITSSFSAITTLKRRGRCNPYGFALNASLTDNQAAILGALGFSRTPKRR